jgi:uncharacterized protein (TIGR00255 family)
MLSSMTGFGTKSAKLAGAGKVSVELRSTNHKFLEVVFHLPEGFISLEERLKKEIESRIKRGRVTCVINLVGEERPQVCLNQNLLSDYLRQLHKVQKEFKLAGGITIDTVLGLPGVLSLESGSIAKKNIWPQLSKIVISAVDSLAKTRLKEGRALGVFLKRRAEYLLLALVSIKKRYKDALKKKISGFATDEERSSFLKSSDISEELERLEFHVRNFKNRILRSGSAGKELDFIAQEMQREANTMAAKSFNAPISTRVVQIKSSIEKIREQVQNVE